jgi:heme ABC exporter ATP-binding subunit CcmA
MALDREGPVPSRRPMEPTPHPVRPGSPPGGWGPPQAPVVHLRGAVALLGAFPALAGADLDVAAREIVLLQGPNGAGKTTLLRVLAGLVPVTEGEAVVLGVDLRTDRKAVRHRVGMLGHGTGLYDELTVADNVRFWARAARARTEDAEAALERLGLDGRLRHVAVGRLSTGQRRRTSLACLVARRPELWLLDEPHAGLDQDGRDLLDQLVRDAAAAGATVVLSSHELDRALALADRVVTVAGGTTRAEPAQPQPTPPLERQEAGDVA